MPTAALFLFVLLGTLLTSLLLTGRLLPHLRAKHFGQHILEIGPRWHKNKEGTPTMGGVVFLLTVPVFAFLGGLLIGEISTPLLLTLLYALANGMIGLTDDYAKFKKRENQGLTPRQKLILQISVATAYLVLLRFYGILQETVALPFFNISISLGIWFYPLAILLMVGMVNFANLTDGIDGLASSVALLIGLFLSLEGIFRTDMPLMLLGCSMAGTVGGFLFFNLHPAKIFMGDTGSLFLGGLVVGSAFLLQMPLLVILFGGLYVIEGISVILQVLVFKLTKKRLFRMAPLHHHFEKIGWGETEIVTLFSLATLFTLVLAHFGLL